MSIKHIRTRVTAHAGCLGTDPNSLDSFIQAISYPVDCLEADVRFRSDGQPYLSNAPLLPKEQQNAMPLTQLLQMVREHPSVILNLDMKEFTDMKRIQQLVRQSGLIGRVFLTGVTMDVLPVVRRNAPDLPYYLNVIPTLSQRFIASSCDHLVRFIRESNAIGLNTQYRNVTALLQRVLSESELKLSVYTVDRERDMRRFLSLPVNNITTRRIDTLIDLRSRITRPSSRSGKMIRS